MSKAAANRAESIRSEIEPLRQRINRLRKALGEYFVDKTEMIDLMVVCTLAQEPLLFVGRPGTAKSDLVVKYCQALGLGDDEYFEYMLTKFTEPSEIIGPIDISELKDGRYIRRIQGKLPSARIVFLDEIFKSNSAILNTLLTIINERKFYQEGRPVAVPMVMLFAATNEVPEFSELDALKDRFTIKCESLSVRDSKFDQLIDKGMRNDMLRASGQKPWTGLCSLEDFVKLKSYFDGMVMESLDAGGLEEDRKRYFPDEVFSLFRRILRDLEHHERVEVSDRKVIKLYKLLRMRAFLMHGGVVTRDDLVLLRYIGNRDQDFSVVRAKVDALLQLDRERAG
jgi:MoxR-like ATPase